MVAANHLLAGDTAVADGDEGGEVEIMDTQECARGAGEGGGLVTGGQDARGEGESAGGRARAGAAGEEKAKGNKDVQRSVLFNEYCSVCAYGIQCRFWG